ncbi:patatin-like phospholipase family protein [Paraglaciecola sp.]|uniref:patatin-like phospholipase family protein n=1 Tax=Paraglaciecola sp. TaxID=1920173 RepID=UPI0030F40701
MLNIYAGANAINTLKNDGFNNDVFSSFLGASGGPKWFTLFGLDKYLFSEFFKQRTQPLTLIGSSAGAFRAACFAQRDPVSAISRLAKYYSETVYSDNITPAEISRKARLLLAEVFGSDGASHVIQNPVFQAHFIVAKTKGLVAFENKALQLTGLLKSYAMNRVSRSLLRSQYERVIYQSPYSNLKLKDDSGFITHHIELTAQNISDALLASGSIPIVMQGIKNISGSPKGMYRDGGIIDYHFDLKIESPAGLCLYPHFNANPKAGWFDKNLKRAVNPQNYSNTVMLAPSDSFIKSLPYSKIPDREDFTTLTAAERIKYWKTVLSETERLAEALADFINKQDMSVIKAL